MNSKLELVKEVGKLSAYAFVLANLAGITLVQFGRVQDSFAKAFKK